MRKILNITGLFLFLLLFGATNRSFAFDMNHLYRQAGNTIAGNPKGQITMVEFFDYNCGYCRLMYADVADLIKHEKNLRVIFREYPILGQKSLLPAKAALAAQKQGKYESLHDAMMNAKMPLDQNEIIKLATGLKIDTHRLLADIQSPEINKQIQENLAIGQAINIQGVPTFIIARTTPPSKNKPLAMVGPSISDLQKMIQEASKAN